MKDVIIGALAFARELGADFADVRAKDITTEAFSVENGRVVGLSRERSRGAGVRVYAEGAMGFAAAPDLRELQAAVRQAFELARAAAKLTRVRPVLAPKDTIVAEYATPVGIDPFTVPLGEKLELLLACDAAMTREGVSLRRADMDFRREDVVYADTDGSYILQKFMQSGANICAYASSEADTQRRSYGNILRAGYEAVTDMGLLEKASVVAAESLALLNAEECPSGVFDLILMPTQLYLQIHESVGHPTELDRVLGSEAAYAGASFLKPSDIHSGLQYGSEHVTISADAYDDNGEHGLGAFGYDDEGVPAQHVTLIENGFFTDFQTSRDNAPAVGQPSHGMGLADGWHNLPIVRMTNVNLQPGDYKLTTLIEGIRHGFVLSENKSWSIDDLRINFQFACELAREIKNGKLTGKIYKNPIYFGKTTEFWNSCDGVSGAENRLMVGVPNCGKGQPLQVMRVGHASQPARFRNVKVGVGHVG
jgi:TldD protein